VSEKLLDLGQGLELWRIDIDTLLEQDENARVMSRAMFKRLEDTIGRDKRLGALPFCAATDKGIEIVSGHHRIRAAREAGLSEVHAIVDVTGLSKDQIRAKQLAHNSISGEDDEQVLARIYSKIADVEARLESFIDPKVVEKAIQKAKAIAMDLNLSYRMVVITFMPIEYDRFVEAADKVQRHISVVEKAIQKAKAIAMDLNLSYRMVVITFMPIEYDRFVEAADKVQRHISKDVLDVWLASIGGIEKFREAAKRAGLVYEVRAMGTVLDTMAEIVLAQLQEEAGEAGAEPGTGEVL